MASKSKSSSSHHTQHANHDITHELAKNLVELQKVHTNLVEKFDNLSKQLSELLTLFQMAARSFAQHPANQVAEKDSEFLDKIDKLLEQNKVIAKGFTIMEEKVREKPY